MFDTVTLRPRCRDLSVDRRAFSVGNTFFNETGSPRPRRRRVATGSGPSSTPSRARRATSRTGGPSRRSPTNPSSGLLLRLSVPGPAARRSRSRLRRPAPGPAINGVPAEATVRITYTEVPATSPTARPTRCGAQLRSRRTRPSARCPPTCYHRGRPTGLRGRTARGRAGATMVLEAADPDDADGDGISGRANHVSTGDRRHASAASAGRPTSRPSSSRSPAPSTATSASPRPVPGPELHGRQTACLAAPNGGTPESTTRSSTASSSTRARSPCPPAATGTPDRPGRAAVHRRRVLGVPQSAAADRASPTSPRSATNPAVHRPAPARHGPGLADGRPTARPPAGVADRAAVGNRPLRP